MIRATTQLKPTVTNHLEKKIRYPPRFPFFYTDQQGLKTADRPTAKRKKYQNKEQTKQTCSCVSSEFLGILVMGFWQRQIFYVKRGGGGGWGGVEEEDIQ